MSYPDLFDGWFDCRSTGYRTLYVDDRPTRRAHKSSIVPHAYHAVMRQPWGTYPDVTINVDSEALCSDA